MSQWPPFSRSLPWIAILVMVALVALGEPASWAAPVPHPPNQTVPSRQQTHLPLVAYDYLPISSCEFDLDLCQLLFGYTTGFLSYDWAPDGRTFAIYLEDNEASGLYVINEQGKNKQLLLELSNIVQIQYSPDGTKIALIVSRPGSLSNSGPANGHILYDLYVYTFATRQLRPLSDTTSEDFSDLSPNWSPESNLLAFTRIQHDSATGEPTNGDIYTIDVDSGELAQLTDTSQHEHLPTYSPDGTRIAYISVKEDSNNPSIAVMKATGEEPIILTSTEEEFFANEPFWALDSNSIFFFGSTRNSVWDIYRVEVDGSGLVNLTNDPLQQSHPLLSPDGSQILFIGRVETPEVYEIDFYTMNVDGNYISKHPNPHGSDQHPGGVQWHPDSKRISYSEHRNIYLWLLEAK